MNKVCTCTRPPDTISHSVHPLNSPHLSDMCALSGYIFVNPFTSCVTDRYQYKQCIMMETETETNMKICMYSTLQ